MAPTIGRVALDNGFHGSIPGDWVAPPPQNIQRMLRIVKETVLSRDNLLLEDFFTNRWKER